MNEPLSYELQSMAANAIAHAATMAGAAWTDAACRAEDVERERQRPFMLLRPRMSIDGNQWCALYGDNLQDGVAGFGDTPAQAAVQFDIEWLNARALVAKKEKT